jgi:SSS family solute:Na+ symporter
MTTHFATLDLAILLTYFVLTMLVGFLIGRRNRSIDGHTAAGRRLPGWLTGLSILGTYVSSITFIAAPGKSYASNWNPFVFSLSIPLAAWIAVRWFVPFYRRSGHVSAYEHLEQRFGPWARMYANACYLLTQLARAGAVMYLMALPLGHLLGWDLRWLIIATGVSVTIYTFVGGLTAVIWTDAIQTVVLIGGALLCVVWMLVALPGGVGEVMQVADVYDKFSLGSFGGDLATATFWVVLLYGIATNLQNLGIDQNYVQRYLAAKSDREARKSVWLGSLVYVPLSAAFFFIGTALFAYYMANPGDLPPGTKPDAVFPWFIVSVLPPGLTGLLVAAIFAAAMSTVSTSLNSSATVVLADYYRRYVNTGADERSSLWVLRVTTIAIGTLGTGVALIFTHAPSALDFWWILSGIFGGGMLGLFLLGLLARQASSHVALVAAGVGLLVITWMVLSPVLPSWPEVMRSPFHAFLIGVFGTATTLLVGFAATLIVKRKSTSSTRAAH